RDLCRVVNERREQEKLRVAALPVDRREKKLELEPAGRRTKAWCLVAYHEREWSTNLLFPSAAEHQVELLGRRHQDPELPGLVLVGQHARLETVDLERRAHLLDDGAERGKVPAQTKRQLIHERARWGQIRYPAALVVELIEGLEDAELGDERLAARGREAHDD